MSSTPAPGFFAGGESLAIPDFKVTEGITRQMKRFSCRFLVLNRERPGEDRIASGEAWKPIRSFPGGRALYRLPLPSI
jgi:hypothetical protein